MNYNPNAGIRNPQGPGRKIKRVSDVNAMGPTANSAPSYVPNNVGAPMSDPMMDPMMTSGPGGYGPSVPQGPFMGGGFNNCASMPMQSQNFGYAPAPAPSPHPQTYVAAPTLPQSSYVPSAPVTAPGFAPGQYSGATTGQFAGSAMPQQFAMFQQPVVQDMAMQYGQHLADQGKQLVENQFEKWVPVSKLKYYFAVDNNYVINKLRLLFFPFTHRDWSLKYDQENPVQPRYDINAPDLYIPTMAYITYVVVAGLMLGMQKRFSPEQLGIQASSALAYSIFELVVYSITLYVVNIKTNLKTLDLVAFSGYKFVIIVACLLASTLFHGPGYYAMLSYTSLTLGFFLLRTLKTKVLQDNAPAATTNAINYDPYGNPQQLDYSGGRKRKLYFLFLIVGGQSFLAFLLSKHLYFPDAATLEARNDIF